MNINIGLDLMVVVEFVIIHQLVGIGSKPYAIVTYITFQPGKTIPYFHIYNLHACSEIIMIKDKNGQDNELNDSYTCKISKLCNPTMVHDQLWNWV